MIRGDAVDGVHVGDLVNRNLKPTKTSNGKAYFVDAPRRWMMVDYDKFLYRKVTLPMNQKHSPKKSSARLCLSSSMM